MRSVIVVLFVVCGAAGGESIREELAAMKPLPKTHHSCPVYDQQLIDPTPELIEVFRVCRSVPVGDNSEAAIRAAGDLARRVNAQVAVNLSPWPVSRCAADQATPGSPAQWAEVAYWAQRLSAVRGWLGKVEVGAVLIDDERWIDQPVVMAAFRTALYEIAHEAFPSAAVCWYAFGAIGPDASPTGWSDGRGIFGNAWIPTDAHSVSLYCLAQEYRSQESYRRSVATAPADMPVIPWIALAAGYEPQVDRFHVWRHDWDYGLIWACRFGAQINQPWYVETPERQLRFAPWQRARFVVLYPSCTSGSPAKGRAPRWLEYFVAYARGAHGRQSIAGIGEGGQR